MGHTKWTHGQLWSIHNSHRSPDTTRQCCLCRVGRCELSRPDRPTSAFCVGVRPAVATAVPAPPDTLRSRTHLSGRLSSYRNARHDKTVLSVSCLVPRCELDDCSERVQTSIFLSATVLSRWESNSHRRSGRDTDKTVLSCLVWRCELALGNHVLDDSPDPHGNWTRSNAMSVE